jgi:hypothetical protein
MILIASNMANVNIDSGFKPGTDWKRAEDKREKHKRDNPGRQLFE